MDLAFDAVNLLPVMPEPLIETLLQRYYQWQPGYVVRYENWHTAGVVFSGYIGASVFEAAETTIRAFIVPDESIPTQVAYWNDTFVRVAIGDSNNDWLALEYQGIEWIQDWWETAGTFDGWRTHPLVTSYVASCTLWVVWRMYVDCLTDVVLRCSSLGSRKHFSS